MKVDSRKRALRLALERFHAIERSWENARERERLLRELRNYLDSLNSRPGLGLRHIANLARHIDESTTLPHLCGLLVPVEREHERANVTDEDFIVTVKDVEGRAAALMPVTVILDNLRSAFNIGGIFRTGECVGVRKLVLCGYSATPDNEKVSHSALGTQDVVAWEQAVTAQSAVEQARSEGAAVIALETVQDGPAPHEVEFKFPCAVVLGNERFGLGRAVLAAADQVVSIPVYGRKNSLNVVSAFAVCAYELRRQWEQANSERGTRNADALIKAATASGPGSGSPRSSG
jgi:tRNA G18 (ribose-2'-O)-methylase SpoU